MTWVRSIPIAAVSMLVGILLPCSPAAADDGTQVDGHAASDAFAIEGNKAMQGSASSPVEQSTSQATDTGGPDYVKYKWASVCATAGPASSPGDSPDCGQAQTCPQAEERLWRLWGQTVSGRWDSLEERCAGPQGPPPAATPKPQVTPGLVLTELRRIGLPSLQARTQPRDKTLVNFATIFYAEPQTFTRTLTLLGQSVDVEATPTSFTWHYGDGSSATTSTPGAPYPAKDVTHSYTCLLYTSPSPRDLSTSRMPSSA